MAECNLIPGGCPTGEAVITTGGRLKGALRHPHRRTYLQATEAPERKRSLKTHTMNSLALASARGLESVAFPSISTGVYGYPVEEAASTALRAVREFVKTDGVITLIRFVLFSDRGPSSLLGHALKAVKASSLKLFSTAYLTFIFDFTASNGIIFSSANADCANVQRVLRASAFCYLRLPCCPHYFYYALKFFRYKYLQQKTY